MELRTSVELCSCSMISVRLDVEPATEVALRSTESESELIMEEAITWEQLRAARVVRLRNW